MSKLPQEHKFIDLSDYGRPAAKIIAISLKNTSLTPLHVTFGFIIAGCIAIYCILSDHYFLAAFFLIVKSILDAADGELSRVKQTPSYVGRYTDSVADIILNFFIFLAIWYVTDISIWICFLAFLGLQLQGTLYNYYYVILRNRFAGDTTSRVIEDKTPIALPGESQKHVNVLFFLYKLFYSVFDKAIYALDRNASKGQIFPNWLMTFVSTFGLGFQLFVIAFLLVFDFKHLILPFFVAYTAMIFICIGVRRYFYHFISK